MTRPPFAKGTRRLLYGAGASAQTWQGLGRDEDERYPAAVARTRSAK